MTRIVLVGAGSLQFGAGFLGDIFQSEALGKVEIILNDINLPAVGRTLTMARDHIEAHGLDHEVSVEAELGDALCGADFVVISIEVGDRFALWDLDWKIPQQYGIHQIYGENGGPGGLFHSLRIIPPILEICSTIMEVAPDATVFNFSNPMSRICTTVHRKFPELTFIGMCHEVASLERHLPPILGVDRSEISYRAGGLNHMAVLTEVVHDATGRSAYDDVMARAPEYFSRRPGYSEILDHTRRTGDSIETEGWMDIAAGDIDRCRPWSDRWLFREFMARFGALPITTDSHLGEYIQWAHECADHRGILDFYTYYRNFLGSVTPSIRHELRERVVPIIEGILTGNSHEEPAVNIPNRGFIRNLPDWLAVEVPAMVGGNGVDGIAIDIPPGVLGLLCNQVGIHDMTANAVLEQRRDLVVQALLVDPVVTVSQRVPELVDQMISEQKPWLDYLR